MNSLDHACFPDDVPMHLHYNHAFMNPWYIFWMLNLAVAGSAFVVIAIIVLVRGTHDLRQMFKNLREEAGRQ
jgi:hypothetical protein